MITFETQEAFENAVMNAIRFRCVMKLTVICSGDRVSVSTALQDEQTGAVLVRAEDTDTVVIYQSDIR